MYRKAGVDTVVFDIADVGARFYTYTWTMYIAMEAAAQTGAAFIVLDRPNPIGGQAFGPQLDPKFASGVGMKPIVQQPGMTVGELARMFDAEFLPGERRLEHLEIVKVRGWPRDTLFAQTGLNWVLPSPNMPTPDTALVYPGTCMFEGTLFSEGRGTTRPFEMIGAPGIDWRWREKLEELRLPGVEFRETYFVPTFSKFVNQTCGGVQVSVDRPARLRRHPHRGRHDRDGEGAVPGSLRLAAGQLHRQALRFGPAADAWWTRARASTRSSGPGGPSSPSSAGNVVATCSTAEGAVRARRSSPRPPACWSC